MGFADEKKSSRAPYREMRQLSAPAGDCWSRRRSADLVRCGKAPSRDMRQLGCLLYGMGVANVRKHSRGLSQDMHQLSATVGDGRSWRRRVDLGRHGKDTLREMHNLDSMIVRLGRC